MMTLKTNAERLVKTSVMGEVSHPISGTNPYRVTTDGKPLILPGVGGITYNIRVGEPATGWVADHVEPGVSVKNYAQPEFGGQASANNSLNLLACVGNEAVVISGDAKGEKGVVTGKHGEIEHVLVDFKSRTLEKLVIGDKILIKAFGTGLRLGDFPQVRIMNLDPALLKRLKLRRRKDKLAVPVTHVIPAKIMGSGLGAIHTHRGDYDVQLFDEQTVREFGLSDLRLGDFVAIADADHSYGRLFRTGAVSIGIVVHTDCVVAGHGPGVTTLLTSREGEIAPVIEKDANIATLMKLR